MGTGVGENDKLETGGRQNDELDLSDLGLAQSEEQLSTTNSRQKDRDLPCRLFIGNGVSISRQEEGSGKQGENSDVGCLQQGTSGRFTTRTEDLCTVQQKAIVQCPLVCSWGC